MLNDFRLRIRHFYRRNKKIIFIFISITVIIFMINQYLKHRKVAPTPQTTYEPHTSVIDTTSKVPQSTGKTIENMIEKYMEYCNSGDWVSAFQMLSSDCREYEFNNNLDEFMKYEYIKMPTPKKYAIQDYSNIDGLYIYQIKYTDDFLATGLTNSAYTFTEEKMSFKKSKDGKYEMSIGNFIDYHNLKNIFENDYIKVDLKSVERYYSMEAYKIVITNRCDYPIVIANNVEENEVCLRLASGDYRDRLDMVNEIVVAPQGNIIKTFKFTKFYDNDDASDSIYFNSIRVLSEYNGVPSNLIETEEIVNEQNIEEQNSIAKFSMNLPIKFKD